ncbi:DUF1254 domain-containing protein [Paraburkholderia phymatum]|uniref:DUF1254 domain-containing protein n=1 Tax=Paraburkholderia phymatum TaxID=148447 RepID=A0ACC6TXQ8_9BURK
MKMLRAAFTLAVVFGAALMSADTVAQSPSLSTAEAREIAMEAYVYGYSLVDNYRIQYAYFVDRDNPEYKGDWNRIANVARVYTPQDKAIQTPNSDTPYSFLGADLRTEPLVLTVPEVEQDRYYAAQFVDLYTYNFAYVGTRTTGNGSGKFLLVGPNWKGPTPKGIKGVIRSDTDLAFVLYRTQLFRQDDIGNVRKVQAGFKAEPLSVFLGEPSPAAAPAVDYLKPLTREQERTSLEFFDVLNFVLRFCPTYSDEQPLMDRFAKLGIGAGRKFDAQALSPEIRKAVEQGIADAWRSIDELGKRVAAGEVTSGDITGSRAYLKNNYLYRMRATVAGIYGNSKEEAIYPAYYVDASGQRPDGGHYRYTLRFKPGQLPPVNAFWSLTMYLPSRLLVANPLDRYLINSAMLADLKRDADGGVTLYLQHDSPGKDKEANWLPAPDGQFLAALRLYWPKQEALDGEWKQPPLQRSGAVMTGSTDSR